jgi:hypothetical protein
MTDNSELDQSLSVPSFEEELAATAIPNPVYIDRCNTCGAQVLIEGDGTFKCPNYPHEIDDNNVVMEDDIEDEDSGILEFGQIW